ncbi:MAG: RNA polymerase sigma factor [bacterium]
MVQAFLQGENEAFEALFERYRSRIFGYVRRLVRDRDLAEEIFQEVFLHLFRQAPGFDPTRSFRAWFFRLAHNRAMDILRRRRGKGRFEDVEEDSAAWGVEPSAEDRALEAASARRLERLLGSLGEDQRAVVLLKFVEGLTYEEIAGVLDCPVGTAKSRAHHALRRLREMVEREK